MAERSDIEWCDSTVNPTTGCDGCELHIPGKGGPCYAGILHEGRLAKSLPDLYAPKFTDVRLAPGRMAKAAGWPDLRGKPRPDKPWLDGMPRVIFVGDMGDVFSHDVPFMYLYEEIIATATSKPGNRHIYMLLTKQVARAIEFATWLRNELGQPWPENVWQGASITNAKNETRADMLAYHPAPTKYLSVEPLLGPVSFAKNLLLNFELVIGGGESGIKARPMHIDWVRSLRDQCVAAGVPFFFKQHGEWEGGDVGHPRDGWRTIGHSGRLLPMMPGPESAKEEPRRVARRVGKRAAGRVLDGRTWDEFPRSEVDRG